MTLFQRTVFQDLASVLKVLLGMKVRGDIELWIISRRSRFRAGTRYLRRGIDDSGKVANYVETEQIMIFKKHVISFVQTRGSIPVFWSQPGFRYRPPPRLDRGEYFVSAKSTHLLKVVIG